MKRVFLAICLFCISCHLMAQEEKIRFGGKAGINLSEIRGSTDYRTSFHVGVLTEIPVLNKISVQPELVYSSQGGETVTSDFEAIFKLDYLNIPVMLKLYLGKRFNFQAGPQVGFLLSARRESVDSFGGITETLDEDIKSFLSDVDFGLSFGLAYQWKIGVFIDTRYNLGVTDISKVEFNNSDIENGTFQFSLGYMFL